MKTICSCSFFQGKKNSVKLQAVIFCLFLLPAQFANAQTVSLLKDIYSGTSGSNPGNFVLLGGGSQALFVATTSANGTELWITDGTASGTVLLKDINAGSASSNPSNLTLLEGGRQALFVATTSAAAAELWITDGTASGTVLLKDINPGNRSSNPMYLTAVGSNVFFNATDPINSQELWKSDGTPAGTVMVKDINPAGTSNPSRLNNVDGILYFSAIGETSGSELWKSDGTDAGTVMVKDIIPGSVGGMSASHFNSPIISFNNISYFVADSPSLGNRKLFRSDGTDTGTYVLKDINPGGNDAPGGLIIYKNALFFTATNAAAGTELWKTDGTAAGTYLFKDLRPGSSGSSPANFIIFNDTLFFTADNGTNGTEWYKTGTDSTSLQLIDACAGGCSNQPSNARIIGNTLFYSGYDGTNSTELWKTNGTLATTAMIKDVNPGANAANPANLINYFGLCIYSGDSSSAGNEIFRSDGTASGTYMLSNINTGSSSSNPANFILLGTRLLFTATTAARGNELYVLTSSISLPGIATWTGNINTRWYEPGNWSPTIIPRSTDSIVINRNVSLKPVLGLSVSVKSIYIDSSAWINLNTFSVSLSGYLGGKGTIRGGDLSSFTFTGTGPLTLRMDQGIPGKTNRLQDLTLNRGTSPSTGELILGNTTEVSGRISLVNGTLTTGGNLTLVSNSTRTASIGAIGNTADIAGAVTAQRYIPRVTRRSRMLSSPARNFNSNQYIDDIFVSGPGGVSNGFDASPANGATINTYKEDTGGTGRGWKGISNINTSFAAGQGVLVFVRGDRTLRNWAVTPYPQQNEVTIDYTSQPVNKGDISPAITFTNTGALSDDGWNFVGNPYPSQIDWTRITKTNLSSFFYSLNPATGSYEADNGTKMIASGQGFFVQAVAANPGITFTESCKTSASPVNYFKTGNSMITAKMTKDQLNSDWLKIKISSGANKDYKTTEDAIKMTNTLINFAALSNHDSIQLQYSTIPSVAISDTIKLYADAANGTYDLSFEDLESINTEYDIYLHDALTNGMQNLRSTPGYTFTITAAAASKGTDRFKLILINTKSLPVKLLAFTGKQVKEDVELTWSTAYEKNSRYVMIERSDDNKSWQLAGVVNTKGNSSAMNKYLFIDHNVIKSTAQSLLYYRLKQVDRDNTPTLSNTIMLAIQNQVNADASLQLFPNPASNRITIKTVDTESPTCLITIADAMGKVIMESVCTKQQGKVSLDVSGLHPGVYLLTCKEETGTLMRAGFVKE